MMLRQAGLASVRLLFVGGVGLPAVKLPIVDWFGLPAVIQMSCEGASNKKSRLASQVRLFYLSA